MTTTPLQDLESRSYSTYLARVEAARRLKSREHAWNASLVSLTVAVTIAAVALLVDPEVFGPRGEALMVCLSVLSLAAAIIVPSLNYSRRANDMSVNYRRIQQLSVDAERAVKLGLDPAGSEARQLYERYGSLIHNSENHSPADFSKAQREQERKVSLRSGDRKCSRLPVLPPFSELALTALPYLSLVVPIAVVVRLVSWFFGG